VRLPAPSRRWRGRLLTGAVVAAVGYGYAFLLRFDPQPVPYVVMSVVVLALAWLVLDTADAETPQWVSVLPRTGDRVDEATSDLRVLTSHQQARAPSEALRDRLVALARGRDPDLGDALHAELEPDRRLSPAEIDRILTRIEEARD